MKIYRIAFKIDRELNEIFSKYAETKGIPKSKVIIQNIKSDPKPMQKVLSKKRKNHLYSFRVSEEDFKFIQQQSSDSSLNVSEYLYSFISHIVAKDKVSHYSYQIYKPASSDIFNLDNSWARGSVNEISDHYSKILDSGKELYNSELYKVVSSFIFTNRFKEILAYLNFIIENQQTITHPKLLNWSLILKAHVCIHDRNVALAKEIIKYKVNENLLHTRLELGTYYCVKAEIAYISDNLVEGIYNFKKSLEYFDIINFQTEIINIYIRLARALRDNLELMESKQYLVRTLEILNSWPNYYMESYCKIELSYLKMIRKNFIEAKEYMTEALRIGQTHNLKRQIFYALDGLGKFNLLNRNYSDAYKNFSKVIQIEKETYSDERFSYASAGIGIITSIDNWDKGNKIIENNNELSKRFSIKPTLSRYLLAYNNYKFGEDKQSGFDELQLISQNTPNPAIKCIAEKTLIYGDLQGFL